MNNSKQYSSLSPATPFMRIHAHTGVVVPIYRQTGVTLIEVLVTLLLVSIGLIGSFAMQARAVQDNQSAYYRSQAVNMATDMADRIRLNSSAATTYDDVVPTSTIQNFTANGQDSAAVALAKRDIRTWLEWVQASLPSGRAQISNRFKICVFWDENKDSSDGKNINDPTGVCSIADASGSEAYFGLEIEI